MPASSRGNQSRHDGAAESAMAANSFIGTWRTNADADFPLTIERGIS
jgi:hypothetical protein